MDEETQRHMFEPFFTTKEGAGAGLGMPMVYGLMQQQGGAVTVDSLPGEGTTVRLLFPIPKHRDTDTRAPTSPTPKRTVLLVEDEPAIRQVTAALLLEAGYAVQEAPDGRRALDILSDPSAAIDVVMCDLVMPKMGGAELFDAAQRLMSSPPFVFVTGYAPEDVLTTLSHDRSVRILRKPYRLEQLLSVLAQVVDDALRLAQ
jgi:CheY-like chemotaxis protein